MYKHSKLSVIKSKVYFAAKILLVIFFISVFASSLFAEEIILKNGKTIKGKIEKKTRYTITIVDEKGKTQYIKRALVKEIIEDVIEPKPVEKPGGGLVALLQPRLGMYIGMKFPLGSLSTPVSIGGGAHVFSDIKIPLPITVINLRGGLDVGYTFFQATQLDTSMHFVPVALRAAISYPLSMGIEPYLTIGGGMNYVLLGADAVDPASSSLDGMMSITAGVSYTHEKMKNFEVFLDLGYMASFETEIGHFFQLNLGFAYRFGGTQKGK